MGKGRSSARTANPDQNPARVSEISRYGAALLFLATLAHFLYAVSIGWEGPIIDHHAFRQTQTAISTYYILRTPLAVAYPTPILGNPWAIPFEFPLFQWTVAGLVSVTGMAVDQAGRFVAVACYLGILFPTAVILRQLRVRTHYIPVAGAILLASPFYTFWARTFMIETMALLLGVAYAAVLLPAIRQRKIGAILSACLLGTLAGMVKITTALPFALIPAFILAVDFLRVRPLNFRLHLKPALIAASLSGIPVLAGILWTRFADSVKRENALGAYITSQHLSDWNFGTLTQKLSWENWETILGRTPTLLGSAGFFWTSLVLLALTSMVLRQRWRELLGFAFLFLLAPALFTNLHLVHDYYMCANGIFALGAVSIAVIGIGEKFQKPWISVVIAGLLLVAASSFHSKSYAQIQRRDFTPILGFAESIKKQVSEEEVIILIGFDWDPMIPYYAQRKALMIPDWAWLPEQAVIEACQNIGREKVGLILIREGAGKRNPRQIVAYLQQAGVRTDRVATIR